MKRDEYASKISRFGKSLEKKLLEDFPENHDLRVKIDNHIAAIQLEMLTAFLKKGHIE